MAIIYMNFEQLADKPLKDFDFLNYILAASLKANKIPPEQLGLVVTYLDLVGPPDLYFEYAILRVA